MGWKKWVLLGIVAWILISAPLASSGIIGWGFHTLGELGHSVQIILKSLPIGHK